MKKCVAYILSLILMVALASCGSAHKMNKSPGNDHEFILSHLKRPDYKGNLSGRQKHLINEAYSWEGTPYQYGGNEKHHGVDCSGLVLRVYEKVTGIKLPRSSREQAEFCNKIKRSQVRPGDLVFFATGKDPERISHVGMMVDDDLFIHASTSKGVCVSSVSTPYYQKTFMMYGRIPQ